MGLEFCESATDVRYRISADVLHDVAEFVWNIQWRSYYGANGASAPPGLFWAVFSNRLDSHDETLNHIQYFFLRKYAKIHLQQSRISKNFRG